MSVQFIPQGVYEDIINIVGQWKIVDIKGLEEMCSYEVSYFNLLKKVRTLESHGLIKGVLLGQKNKHIYLTNKGLQYTGNHYGHEICNENLTHDLVTARVLKELLKFDGFNEGRMFHQVPIEKIYPDAEITGSKSGEDYRLAIEVELTQKSERRVKEKYRRYSRESVFNYGVFITNKERLLRAYKRFLEALNPEIQEAIVLILDDKLSATKFSYQKAHCYYMGNNVRFIDLFGESEELN
ncbi:MAG: hypothetical protein HN353_13035 [Bdellovibrionales bacterium]|jgi:hypothetical protein|nr:hypothetical protein [Bdellovibrionales bacterium]MBT3525931.1 hypothetical protein [Bdellovibrionales bacterium]MBT7670592.1 hypothetical protein [Bdellovibrionales bacterium]MBT7765976.1 hypothetical protein [Bdellovibrionales bacterium]